MGIPTSDAGLTGGWGERACKRCRVEVRQDGRGSAEKSAGGGGWSWWRGRSDGRRHRLRLAELAATVNERLYLCDP